MAEKKLSSEGIDFSWNIYRAVAEVGQNSILSPHSVSSALMLACLGAKGDTANQILKVLGYGGKATAGEAHADFSKLNATLVGLSEAENSGVLVAIANKLFASNGLDLVAKYVKESSEMYASGVESMDFGGIAEECRLSINKWVEQITRNKIKDLLQEGTIGADTRLVLTNAIYFKGKWDKPFNVDKTEKMDFNVSKSATAQVDMMRLKLDLMYFADEKLKFRAISIPYQGKCVAMLVIRPDEIDSLTDVQTSFTAQSLVSTISQLRRGIKCKVDVGLPKFTFTKSSDLSRVLPGVGVVDLFDPAKADLSGMVTGGHGVAIDDVVHKAFIEVNEEGTEAAAATAMISRMCLMPLGDEVTFICDRPFLFFIVDLRNEAILFIGHYAQPE